MATVFVNGASGQLGQSLRKIHSQYPDLDFHFLERKDMDLSDPKSIRNVFARNSIDYFINCAAYTAVDDAEEKVTEAYAVNADSLLVLGKMCAEHNTTCVHISTDYVYHNSANRPLKEDDETLPRSIYGKSKLQGEKYLSESTENHMIIRTSWLYSEFGSNFVYTMKRLMTEHNEIKVVVDQIGTPTYTGDLSHFILNTIQKQHKGDLEIKNSIVNYSNSGVASWYDFAHAIREILDLDCSLIPVPTTEFPRPAPRPAYSVMDLSKLRSHYKVLPRHWREALRECIT